MLANSIMEALSSFGFTDSAKEAVPDTDVLEARMAVEEVKKELAAFKRGETGFSGSRVTPSPPSASPAPPSGFAGLRGLFASSSTPPDTSSTKFKLVFSDTTKSGEFDARNAEGIETAINDKPEDVGVVATESSNPRLRLQAEEDTEYNLQDIEEMIERFGGTFVNFSFNEYSKVNKAIGNAQVAAKKGDAKKMGNILKNLDQTKDIGKAVLQIVDELSDGKLTDAIVTSKSKSKKLPSVLYLLLLICIVVFQVKRKSAQQLLSGAIYDEEKRTYAPPNRERIVQDLVSDLTISKKGDMIAMLGLSEWDGGLMIDGLKMSSEQFSETFMYCASQVIEAAKPIIADLQTADQSTYLIALILTIVIGVLVNYKQSIQKAGEGIKKAREGMNKIHKILEKTYRIGKAAYEGGRQEYASTSYVNFSGSKDVSKEIVVLDFMFERLACETQSELLIVLLSESRKLYKHLLPKPPADISTALVVKPKGKQQYKVDFLYGCKRIEKDMKEGSTNFGGEKKRSREEEEDDKEGGPDTKVSKERTAPKSDLGKRRDAGEVTEMLERMKMPRTKEKPENDKDLEFKGEDAGMKQYVREMRMKALSKDPKAEALTNYLDYSSLV